MVSDECSHRAPFPRRPDEQAERNQGPGLSFLFYGVACSRMNPHLNLKCTLQPREPGWLPVVLGENLGWVFVVRWAMEKKTPYRYSGELHLNPHPASVQMNPPTPTSLTLKRSDRSQHQRPLIRNRLLRRTESAQTHQPSGNNPHLLFNVYRPRVCHCLGVRNFSSSQHI